MSAVAQNYVYRVKVNDGSKRREPVLSAEKIEEFKRDIEKYRAKEK